MADTRDKFINWEGLSRFFQDLKTGYLDTKQDILTAGEGVTIDTSTNTISVQGSGFNPENNSHVEGINTDAEGENSHAEGEGTFTFGNASHAEGRSTVLSNYIQLLGRFTFTANSNTGLTTNSNDMYVENSSTEEDFSSKHTEQSFNDDGTENIDISMFV